jgi:protoheme IX farnesyltransferase
MPSEEGSALKSSFMGIIQNLVGIVNRDYHHRHGFGQMKPDASKTIGEPPCEAPPQTESPQQRHREEERRSDLGLSGVKIASSFLLAMTACVSWGRQSLTQLRAKTWIKESSGSVLTAFKVYLELAKARLTALVVLTAAVGFVLAGRGRFDLAAFLWTVIGTGLTGAGANGFNQWEERFLDRLMDRTRLRPVPSRRIGETHAFLWSLGTSIAGVAILFFLVNLQTALLGLATILLYVLVYTPLKTRSTLCTLVGAVCGAIPPMMGWTGATGTIGAGAWILGAILFVWQIPHSLALAWLYKADYRKGGFRILPVLDESGRLTCHTILLYCLALLPIGLSLSLAGVTGPYFALGSVVLGLFLVAKGYRLQRHRSNTQARSLFIGSLIYLSLLLFLMVVDRPSGEIPPAVAAVESTHGDLP